MFDSVESVAKALDEFSKETGVQQDIIVIGGGACLLVRGLRERTNDLNIWVAEDAFHRLATSNRVFVHPMVDVVLNLPEFPGIWIRKYNPYFKAEKVRGLYVYDLISMITFKRGGYSRPERPKAKRDQDILDIAALNEVYKEEHRVKEAA